MEVEWPVEWFTERKIPQSDAQEIAAVLNREGFTRESLLELGREEARHELDSLGIKKGHHLIIVRNLFGSLSNSSNETITREGIYELLREVRRGGEGVVYEGRRSTDGIRVAIKKLHKEVDGRNAFNEIAIMRTLDHSHIAKILDCYLEENTLRPVMVMPWYDCSLLDFVRRDVARTPTEMIDWIKQTAEGLVYLHSRGIAHRDLKGSNILVELNQNKIASLHLTDFGFSLSTDPDASEVEAVSLLGTAGYIPPEMDIRKGAYSPFPIDIFALGRTIYEVVKGKPPNFRDNTLSKSPDDGEDLTLLIDLSHLCCQTEPKDRPTAEGVLDIIRSRICIHDIHTSKSKETKATLGVGMMEALNDFDKLSIFCDNLEDQMRSKPRDAQIQIMEGILQGYDARIVTDRMQKQMDAASSPEEWLNILSLCAATSRIKKYSAAIGKKGGIAKAIAAMKLYPMDPSIQWKACCLIQRCWKDPYVTPDDAISIMSAMRQHLSHVSLQLNVWLFIKRTLKSSNDHMVMLKKEGLISMAVTALTQKHEGLREHATSTLIEIIRKKGVTWMDDNEISELNDATLGSFRTSDNKETRLGLIDLVTLLPCQGIVACARHAFTQIEDESLWGHLASILVKMRASLPQLSELVESMKECLKTCKSAENSRSLSRAIKHFKE
eukprot:TRINITY_DN9630_c0_g2_i1.p1 TRINITY_DN9630_c0_g2~~TRINITY_DN9630_c0_g2_i1.p1  ORF type:complete len:666 (-),score=145.96 TRINITY_DN9630_c0_g2_i1:10-2007(-)